MTRVVTHSPAPSSPAPARLYRAWGTLLVSVGLVLVGSATAVAWWSKHYPGEDLSLGPSLVTQEGVRSKPLAMQGGDPYLRALMRTISASESNTDRPYAVIYGGQHLNNLTVHPRVCVPIGLGLNRDRCSTAAGRYQMLDVTWEEKAQRYHPRPANWWQSGGPSFRPVDQDLVVYRWLGDRRAWGLDLAAALRRGQLDRVLRRLSGTWTSLGYGIESNRMTPLLPSTYRQLLRDELARASSSKPREHP